MALDIEQTKNQLFAFTSKPLTSEVPKLETQKHAKLGTPEVEEISKEPEKTPSSHQKNSTVAYPGTSKLPKWLTLEKVTVLITSEQKDALDDLARKIMRYRSQNDLSKEERERITANTVLRSLLDNFISRLPLLEIESVQNEKELKNWMNDLFKTSP